MISEVSRRAICAILAADETATDAERERVAASMRGEPNTARRVYTVEEAASILGRDPRTVRRMCQAGRLAFVPSPSGRIGGVVAESLDRFARGVA